MEKITIMLVGTLDIKIDQQRLDSTHIFSDMASFGRTRLMGVAIKRFLTQLKRHDTKAYDDLDELFRQRYLPGVNQLFADSKKDNESRRLLRQQVAEDMYSLVQKFCDIVLDTFLGSYIMTLSWMINIRLTRFVFGPLKPFAKEWRWQMWPRLIKLIGQPFIGGYRVTKLRTITRDFFASRSVGGHAFWVKSVIVNCSPSC